MHRCLRPKRMLHRINTFLIVYNVPLQRHRLHTHTKLQVLKARYQVICIIWWRHQMETFSALLAICAGNNSPHKGQWRGALMFSLLCALINSWVNNRKAGDLRRHRAHYDVTVMRISIRVEYSWSCAPCHLLYTRPRRDNQTELLFVEDIL